MTQTKQSPAALEAFTAALTADIKPLRSGGRVTGGLIQVSAARAAAWISVKPGRRAYIRNASGAAHGIKGEYATEEQDRRLRLRMLTEFGGQW